MSDPHSPDPTRDFDTQRRALQVQFHADIPLTRAMELSVAAYDGDSLSLAAPLAPNINDKGCAFGGSLASLMTLAGWGLVKLAADARGLACDIYVKDSTVRYLAPVWGALSARAELVEGESFAVLFAALAHSGKARCAVHCVVPTADGSAAATLTARFVLIAHDSPRPDAAQSSTTGGTP